ncbi:hypothetical protein SOVF_081820 [Spinacia oleracea]|nr:hypothetical protein SOVF_081820 [Spinacia oleracea]
MKGKKEEVKPVEKENFDICGPHHLTSIDWRLAEHRRSVAASMVQGVFVLERDRQEKRTNHDALAPIWWNFFHFQCSHILVDQLDSSIFGIIFQYKPHTKPNGTPPMYVIAFRGTIVRPETRKRDLHLDIKLAINRLTRDSRYQAAFQAIEGIIAQVGPNNVWLTGHSLGAAIALQAGKDLARMGYCIETYLFNPPYISAPIEKLNDPALRNGARIARSVLNAGLSLAINDFSIPIPPSPSHPPSPSNPITVTQKQTTASAVHRQTNTSNPRPEEITRRGRRSGVVEHRRERKATTTSGTDHRRGREKQRPPAAAAGPKKKVGDVSKKKSRRLYQRRRVVSGIEEEEPSTVPKKKKKKSWRLWRMSAGGGYGERATSAAMEQG